MKKKMTRCFRFREGSKIKTSCKKYIDPELDGYAEAKGKCVFCGKQLGTRVNICGEDGKVIDGWDLYPISFSELAEIVGYSHFNFEEKINYLKERKKYYNKEIANEKESFRKHGMQNTLLDINHQMYRLHSGKNKEVEQ